MESVPRGLRMGAEDTFGQLGRFLLLAFFIPGAAVGALGVWLMPEVALGMMASIPTGLGTGVGALLLIGGFALFSLVATSIPFALEYAVVQRAKVLPQINFGRLAELEAAQTPVGQLTQQIAQGIMHYNVSMGGLLIGIAWLGRSAVGASAFDVVKLGAVLAVILGNYFAAYKFYKWSQEALT